MISQHSPTLRFQAHLAFPQGLPSIQKCQKSLQVHPTPMHGQKDSEAKINRLDNDPKNGQLVTCGHTQYVGCSVIQRLWLVSAFLHLDKDVASKPRTAHTTIRLTLF